MARTQSHYPEPLIQNHASKHGARTHGHAFRRLHDARAVWPVCLAGVQEVHQVSHRVLRHRLRHARTVSCVGCMQHVSECSIACAPGQPSTPQTPPAARIKSRMYAVCAGESASQGGPDVRACNRPRCCPSCHHPCNPALALPGSSLAAALRAAGVRASAVVTASRA